MNRFRMMTTSIGAVSLASILGVSTLMAQQERTQQDQQQQQKQRDAFRGMSGDAQQVTLTGRIVSLHQFMTGGAAGDGMQTQRQGGATGDGMQAQRQQQSGQKGEEKILALVSDRGLVILGDGQAQLTQAGIRPNAPTPDKNFQVQGKLYEKQGIKYLDVTSVKESGQAGARGQDGQTGQTQRPDRP